jgi:hypothetical protein
MRHLERSHTISLPLSAADALPLFTPKGEMDWVPGWAPDFVHPPSGETEAGMVFRTGAGEDLTLWSCTDWEPWRGRVRYARVTPASRFGFVEVECRGESAESCAVRVRYTYTALSVTGEEILEKLTDAAFAAMIEEWRALVLAYLARRAD